MRCLVLPSIRDPNAAAFISTATLGLPSREFSKNDSDEIVLLLRALFKRGDMKGDAWTGFVKWSSSKGRLPDCLRLRLNDVRVIVETCSLQVSSPVNFSNILELRSHLQTWDKVREFDKTYSQKLRCRKTWNRTTPRLGVIDRDRRSHHIQNRRYWRRSTMRVAISQINTGDISCRALF